LGQQVNARCDLWRDTRLELIINTVALLLVPLL